MRPVHVDPEEAVDALLELSRADRGVMGAIHLGMCELTDESMGGPARRARVAWAAAGLAPERPWVPRHGGRWNYSAPALL